MKHKCMPRRPRMSASHSRTPCTHACTLNTHVTHPMHACHVSYVMHAKRGLRAWCAWYTCMCSVCAWLACVMWVRFVRGLHVCVRTCGECVRGVQACVCVPSLSLTSIPLQPLNPHARHAHSNTHTQKTPSHTHTHTYTHLHSYTHERVNLFSRTFWSRENTVIMSISKLKWWPWRAISRLRIDEIGKIQRGFQEYDFEFKIFNWATGITRFTCSMFLLLTVSFQCIFYEIGKLKKNVLELRIRKVWGSYKKVKSFCFNLLFCCFFRLFGSRDIMPKCKMSFFV